MKKLMIRVSLVVTALCSVFFTGCEDKIDPLIEEMDLDRALTPTELTARIRNLTTVELTWNTKTNVDYYVVEFSEDSLEFNTIIFTDEVTSDELPYQHAFAGETRYSARVKAVSEGTEDSKWTAVTIETAQENIFLPKQDGDIQATEATLRWIANSDVTHFVITPGGAERTITAEEKIAGIATITGLTSETAYSVQLKNDSKNRGVSTFTTLIDIGDATAVYPEDDLSAIIAAADAGATLVLFPGNYAVNAGETIVLNKSISIRGLYPYDKPKIHVAFNLQSGATHVEIIDLDLNGTGTITLDRPFNLGTAGVAYGSVKISGCNIHDFGPQFIYGNVAATLDLFSVDNSIITNFSGGGDFIDFRLAYVKEVKLTNSTFNNCAPSRDFIRVDAAPAYTGTGLTTNVLIDHCTLYGVSNTADRIVYVRFDINDITVTNNLFANTDAIYSNQASTDASIAFSNNNYFNAASLFDPTKTRFDGSGSLTQLDPGFVNAPEGDFTITNQTLLDNAVGDPRWRP